MTTGVKQSVLAAIEQARKCYDDPPPNEASTCDWIILPLLYAAGYARRDIVSQASNVGSGYPDYTVLPNSPHTWYLEAKDWRGALDNPPEAIQALNYANAQGRRWVVLSNGREWVLFDNHIQGVEAEKRIVARAELTDPAFPDFMIALGKESVQSGRLGHYAASWRLREVLRQQLSSKDSQVIRAILRVLRKESGLAAIQPQDVVRFFAEPLGGEPVVDAKDVRRADETGHTQTPAQAVSLSGLRSLGPAVRGDKPAELTLPSGTKIRVRTWRDVARHVVECVAAERGLPPLPFRGLKGGSRWFLSLSPIHENGEPMDHCQMDIAGQKLYMDVNRSIPNFVMCLNSLCEVTGAPADGFLIRMAPNDRTEPASDRVGSCRTDIV